MTVSAAVITALEQLLNQAIRLDAEAGPKLASMHGQVIKLEVIGLGLDLYFIPEPGGLQLLSRLEGDPDCTLRGTPLDLARMRGSRESADQLFSGAVGIMGDSALAHRFGNFFADLEIDWEEQLSRLTGDVVAHELGNLTRGLFSWSDHAAKTFGKNLQEYLQEELRLLPSGDETEAFLSDVDQLRDDVDRLQARLARLQGKLGQAE